MKINETLILQCLNELNCHALKRKIYMDYYKGKHEIMNNYQIQDSRSNRKLVFNFPRKFVDNPVYLSFQKERQKLRLQGYCGQIHSQFAD